MGHWSGDGEAIGVVYGCGVVNVGVVMVGGVAANRRLRHTLQQRSVAMGVRVSVAPLAYCTDNAAMIGIVGYLKLLHKKWGTMNQSVSARLPLS